MQRNFILYGSQSAKGGFMKKMYLVNKNIVHLIDDIFWNLGFKTDTQAEKVTTEIMIIICIMHIILIMTIILIMYIIQIMHIILIMYIIHIILIIAFQVRISLGLADHVWQDKRAAIAQTVDALGDQFRVAMRAGWLAYIKNAYPDGVAIVTQSVGQGTLVVDDDE